MEHQINQQTIGALEARCTGKEPPAGMARCPLHVDCRALCTAVAAGDLSMAREIFTGSVPLPHTLSAWCDAPCMAACPRKGLGGAVDMRGLEAVAMAEGKEKKRRLFLPSREERVAVIGGGACGVSAALELGKKGVHVTLMEKTERLGGRLCAQADMTPWDQDCEQLGQYPIEIQYHTQGDPAQAPAYDAVLMACGGDAAYAAAPDTYLVKGNLFAGGTCAFGEDRTLAESIMDGKRAALSIERFLKKVNLLYGREAEGVFTTELPVDLRNAEPAAPPANGADWARAEAGRCLRCDCTQCVDACAFLQHYKTYPRKLLREIATTVSMSMGNRTANTAINSCSLCGQCEKICPGGLDLGGCIEDARAVMVETKHMPQWPFDFALDDMRCSNDPAAAFLCKGAPGAETCDYLFFPGCQLGASAPELVETAFADLLSRFPATGILLGCCGVGAKWAGQQALFEKTQSMLRAQWEALGRPKLIVACPTCMRTLSWAECIGIWDVLGETLPMAESQAELVVHDACGARDMPGVRAGVRALLTRMGYALKEQENAGERAGCCGFGGFTQYANPQVADEAAVLAAPPESGLYLTYCMNCRDRFSKNGTQAVHILELAYGMSGHTPPSYSARRDNRETLKRTILKKVYGMEIKPWLLHFPLYYSAEVEKKLEDRLILEQHIREVIDTAERTGDKLRHAPTGMLVAHKRIGHVTFWAYYLPEGEGFKVERAYSYRMEARV